MSTFTHILRPQRLPLLLHRACNQNITSGTSVLQRFLATSTHIHSPIQYYSSLSSSHLSTPYSMVNRRSSLSRKRSLSPSSSSSSSTSSSIRSSSSEAQSAEQAPTERDNLIDIILSEHREVERLYDAYKQESNKTNKQSILYTIIRELSQHTSCEEMVLYPNAKEINEKAQQESDHSIHEHAEIKTILSELDGMKIEEQEIEVDKKLKHLMDKVDHHVEDEESELLPELRKNLSEERLKQMGSQFKEHKSIATTRPHDTLLPQSYGALSKAGNVVLGSVDKVRDKVEGRPVADK